MAGLEVAGLVLGALPLAVKAIQGYRETFYSIKNVQRDLGYIERDLETEKLRLQNVCETLLIGIVPPNKIDSMIKEPFGPDWKFYAGRLRFRLYTSNDKFEECVMHMLKATEELKLKLGIKEDSQINSRDKASVLEAFKRNASFTLKRKEYEGILSRIQTSNATLQDLSSVHRELEPDRRRRSQSRVTKLLRSLSSSIHDALCNAITCACVYSHSIGLRLAYWDTVMLPGDSEDEVAKEFDFRITFKTPKATNENKTAGTLQHSNEGRSIPHWISFELRFIPKEKPPLTPPILSPVSTTPWFKTRVEWAPLVALKSSRWPILSTSAGRTLAPTPVAPQTSTKNTYVSPPRVSDLCNVALRGPKSAGLSCYGFLFDSHNEPTFVLSPPNDGSGPHKHITLRQVIDRQPSDLPQFGFEDTLRVALVLSASILHLADTPWIAQAMTLDSIVFIVAGENRTNQPSCPFYQPFVVKTVPSIPAPQSGTPSSTPASTTRTPYQGRPINRQVWSLGALLLQLIIGRVESGLEMADALDIDSVVSKWKRGNELNTEVRIKAGDDYAAAVGWCLDSICEVAGLQNDEFCQNFHEAVVGRLEDGLKKITSNG